MNNTIDLLFLFVKGNPVKISIPKIWKGYSAVIGASFPTNAVNFNSVKQLKWVNFELSQKMVNRQLTGQKSSPD